MDASQFVDVSRYNLSAPPNPGRPDYEEQLTNWLIELAFFRDFVYRNPPSKGGKGELADGLVLFRDTALFIQCKSQTGLRSSVTWSQSAIADAARQLAHGGRVLRDRLVPSLTSPTLGTVPFEPSRFSEPIGLIVLNPRRSSPFAENARELPISSLPFPVHVLSLQDLLQVVRRFDTASDFLFYLRERHHLRENHELTPMVHGESEVLAAMSDMVPTRLLENRPDTSSRVLLRTACAFRRKASGRLRRSPAWIRSLMIDDIIARIHEQDPGAYSFPQACKAEVMKIAELLSLLDRSRRASLGAQLLRAIGRGADGTPRAFWRGLRALGICYVFLVCDDVRERRVQLLRTFVARGMLESGMHRGLGIATNSMAVAGRAYDALERDGPLSPSERRAIQDLPSPFGL